MNSQNKTFSSSQIQAQIQAVLKSKPITKPEPDDHADSSIWNTGQILFLSFILSIAICFISFPF